MTNPIDIMVCLVRLGYYADGLSRISSTPTKELAAKKARISLEDDGLVIYTKSNLNLSRGLRISLS